MTLDLTIPVTSLEKTLCSGDDAPLHPVKLTLAGGLIATISSLLCSVNPYTSAVGYIVGSVFDAVDGPLARRNNNKTKQGADYDPLWDKIRNTGVLVPMTILEGTSSPITQVKFASLALDWYNQTTSRGNPITATIDSFKYALNMKKYDRVSVEVKKSNEAVDYGKNKTIVYDIGNMIYLTKEGFQETLQSIPYEFYGNLDNAIDTVLISSMAIGMVACYKGMLERMKN